MTAPLGPVGETEEGSDSLGLPGHHRRRRTAGELHVPGHMVAVPVGVGDDEFVAGPGILRQPRVDQTVHGLPQRKSVRVLGRAGVQQERPVVAEKQEDERRLGMDRLALPEDDGVLVVGMHLDRRIGDPTF